MTDLEKLVFKQFRELNTYNLANIISSVNYYNGELDDLRLEPVSEINVYLDGISPLNFLRMCLDGEVCDSHDLFRIDCYGHLYTYNGAEYCFDDHDLEEITVEAVKMYEVGEGDWLPDGVSGIIRRASEWIAKRDEAQAEE